MIITHKISMDLAMKMMQPPIQAMQEDQYSRELEFELTANGERWAIPNVFSAMIRWHRESDKVGGSYDTLPNGKLAYRATGNKLTVQLVPEIFQYPGRVFLTVMLSSASAVAHTFSVVIDVGKNPGVQDSVPAPAPNVYQQILNEYSMLAARVNNLASMGEGSTTGDAELIDGRVGHNGREHTNIGNHIRIVGRITDQLYTEKTITVSRDGELQGNPVSEYATCLRVVGDTPKYLEKVRLPVYLTESSAQLIAGVYASKNLSKAIATKKMERLPAGEHLLEIDVNCWFYPGEIIVIHVVEVEGLASLRYFDSDADIGQEWLLPETGFDGHRDEDTSDAIFDGDDVHFVGELVFRDTLRDEMQKLSKVAVTCDKQDFTAEEQEQIRKNLGINNDPGISNDPDIHAQYFTITDDGVVSLKPEYRGAPADSKGSDVSDNGVGKAGSKNADLPKNLVIPEIVDGKVVCGLAIGIFRENQVLESVTLPSTITALPNYCFDCSHYLQNVYNTGNIKSVGLAAFQQTGVIRLNFPKLEQLPSPATFVQCRQLVYADIGKVTTIPQSTFDTCLKLNMVKSENKITSVGKKGFHETHNLKHADFSGLKTIGDIAFLRSGVDCDWAALTGCTFGANATPLQYSPTDYWSACTFTPCENRLPTFLCQSDDRWENRQIGTSGKKYSEGCALFTVMHAYCGLHNISASTVEELEAIINAKDPTWLNSFSANTHDVGPQAAKLGLTYERYFTFDQANLQALYNALADGKYGIILYDEPQVSAHAVMVYGINAKGEFLVADSAAASYTNGQREARKYALPISKLKAQANTNNNYTLHIVSL